MTFNPISIEWWRGLMTRHGRKFSMLLVLAFAVPLVLSYGSGWFGGAGSRGRGQAGAAANATVARINGEEITRQQFDGAVQRSGLQPGEGYAEAQGKAFDDLTAAVVIKQAAKKANARPSDADVDRQIAQIKENVLGKNAQNSQWDDYLFQRNKTPSEFRDEVADGMVGIALQNQYLAAENVTEADAKKQYDQVKMQMVLLATELPQGGMLPKGARLYNDADAKKKADELLAKAKTGDIGAIARTESADMSREKGGDTDWRDEYRDGMFGGSLGFGDAFDEAVRKTEKGQFTPIVASAGSPKGYLFAKVTDRRSQVPKTFDAKKEIEQLKQGRAQKKLRKLIQDGVAAAKIEILDPDKKAFYEYAKYQKMEKHKQFGNNPMIASALGLGDGPPPTQPEVDKQKETAYKELEDSLKRNPEDPTLSLLIAKNLEKDLPNVVKNRDRLITLYENALKTMEDQKARFQLANYYRDKGDKVNAAKNYEQIMRMMNASPGYDLNSMQDELTARQNLRGAFKSVDKADLAAKNEAEMQKLIPKIAEETAKQKAAQRQQQPMGGLTNPPPITITPTPPNSKDAPKPKSAPVENKKPDDKPTSGTSKDAKTP